MGKNCNPNRVRICFFQCQQCGHVFPLPRLQEKMREKKHVKDIWCVLCEKITKHMEYKNEYEYPSL